MLDEKGIYSKFKQIQSDSKRVEKIKFDHFFEEEIHNRCYDESVRNLDKYNRIRNAWRKLNSIIFQGGYIVAR